MMNEGIVKINSKMLDSADLKRLDKQEKENISWTGAVVKGKHHNERSATNCNLPFTIAYETMITHKLPI